MLLRDERKLGHWIQSRRKEVRTESIREKIRSLGHAIEGSKLGHRSII